MANTTPNAERQRHVVKRYAASRPYDTTTLSYVTVPQLRALASERTEVLIYEAETGADITQSVLASP
jgi:polyhydroxyalkanoate synthesis regulator protein